MHAQLLLLTISVSTTVVEGKCKFVNYDLEVFEKDIFIRMTDKQNDCQNNGYLNEETVFIVDVYEGPIEHLNGSQSSKSPNLTCTGVSCIEMMKIPREACVSDSGCIVDIQVSSREISPIPYFILDLTTFEVNSHVIKGKVMIV